MVRALSMAIFTVLLFPVVLGEVNTPNYTAENIIEKIQRTALVCVPPSTTSSGVQVLQSLIDASGAPVADGVEAPSDAYYTTVTVTIPTTGEAVDVDVVTEEQPSSPLTNVENEKQSIWAFILTDTLRVSESAEPLTEDMRKERAEGRTEFSEFIPALKETFISATAPISEGLLRLRELKEPISNYIKTNGDVMVVCTSRNCGRFMYSALTKYFNVGASSELVFETYSLSFARDIVEKLTPFLEGKISKLSELKVTGSMRDQLNEIRRKIASENPLSKFSSLPQVDRDAIKDMIKNPELVFDKFKGLSTDGKLFFYTFVKDVSTKAEKLGIKEKDTLDVADLFGNEGIVVNNNIKIEVDKEKLKSLCEFINSLKILENILGSDENIVKSYKKVRDNFEDIDKKDKCKLKKTEFDVQELQKNLIDPFNEVWGNVKILTENTEILKSQIPLFASQVDLMYDVIGKTGVEPPNVRSVMFAVYKIGVPTLAYIFGKNFVVGSDVIFPEEGIKELAGSRGVSIIRRPYQLPSYWQIVYLDILGNDRSYVDVIINNGSDPGDVFISMFSSFPLIAAFDELLRRTADISIKEAFLSLLGSKAHEGVYETKEHIGVLIPSKDSECTLSECDSGVLVLKEMNEVNMSRSIVFFSRTNMYDSRSQNGEPVIGYTDEFSEYFCSNKNPVIRTIAEHPQFSGFTLSLLQTIVIGSKVIPYVSHPILGGVVTQILYSSLLIDDLYTCIDDIGGYYLHTFTVKPEKVENPEIETVQEVVENAAESVMSVISGEQPPKDRETVYTQIQLVDAKIVLTKYRDATPVYYTSDTSAVPRTEIKDTYYLTAGDKKVEVPKDESTSYAITITLPQPAVLIPNVYAATFDQMVQSSGGDELILKVNGGITYGGMLRVFCDVNWTVHRPKEILTEKGVYRIVYGDEGFIDYIEFIDSKGNRKIVDYVEVVYQRSTLRGNRIVARDNLGGEYTVLSITFDGAKVFVDNENEKITLVETGSEQYYDTTVQEAIEKGELSNPTLSEDKGSIYINIDNVPEELKGLFSNLKEKIGDIQYIRTSQGKTVFFSDEDGDGRPEVVVYDERTGERKVYDIVGSDEEGLILRDVNTGEEVKLKLEFGDNGEMRVKLGNEDLGTAEVVQGSKQALVYDPQQGIWELINGVLVPLAEGYKNGVNITFDNGVLRSEQGVPQVINVLGKEKTGGMALPVTGAEIVLIAVLLSLMYYLTVRR